MIYMIKPRLWLAETTEPLGTTRFKAILESATWPGKILHRYLIIIYIIDMEGDLCHYPSPVITVTSAGGCGV
jgi:CO dehydrogenase/acetyl-CoA synthase alpha subunit